MSDLGNDAGSTALSITAKVAEAILKLIDKIFMAIQNSPDRKLTKERLREAKTKNEREAALKELNGKVGVVNEKLMKQTGLPLNPQEFRMKPEDMKRFTSLAERYGLQWYGVMTKNPIDAEGKHQFNLVFYEKDMPKVAEIMDRVKAELYAERRDKRIAELEEKGEGRSPEEEQELQTLYAERDTQKQAVCDQVNDKAAQDVAQEVETGEAPVEDTFDAILNERTGRLIDKDVFSVLVDPGDPSKFIVCHGQQAIDQKGEEYVKTDYKVFKNDQLVAETHDGRFAGRTKDYWPEQKALMKEAGGFGDRLLKFPSIEAAQQWRDRVEKENEEELGVMPEFKKEEVFKRPYAESKEEAFDPNREPVTYVPKAKVAEEAEIKDAGIPEVTAEPVTALHARTLSGDIDYKTIRRKLGDTLEKNGFRLDENEKVVFDNGEPLPMITADMNPKDQMLIAEAKIIRDQYAVYAEMEHLEEAFELAKAEAMTMDEGTEEYANAVANMDRLEASYAEAIKEAEELKELRLEVNGIQVEQQGREEREATKEAEIGKEKDAPEEDGPSDRTSRTVDHRNRPTMDQWKKEVEKKRSEKSAELAGKDVPKVRPGKGKDIGGRD